MGNNDSKHGKSSRRLSTSDVKDLATCLGVKTESDLVTQAKLCDNLVWKGYNSPITTHYWNTISKGSQAIKFSLILDFLDGMLYQDQSYVAKYLLSIVGEMSFSEFARSYTSDLLKLFYLQHSPTTDSWLNQGVPAGRADQLLTHHFTSCLQTISAENKEELILQWLQRQPLLCSLQRAVVSHLFKLSVPSEIVPLLTSPLSPKPLPTILDLSDVIFINNSLPLDMQSEWSLLFSTRIHGLSFTSMLAKLTNKGPTVIIVEDTKQNIFGGFSSESWRLGPKFLGDIKCFLFKLRPFMSVYSATGYNDHYMYLNIQQQTMPNGLGMGGQLGNFGIWIDADFGKGHSSAGCSTYHRMPTLSSEKDFTLEHVEVWAVGPPPKEDSDDETDGKRSILDKDSGAKALLELVDRGHHSEGLREIPDEDY